MACFLVPTAEAVVTTVMTKVIESKEKTKLPEERTENEVSVDTSVKIPLSRKMKWLNNMLWGGSALLAFEHVWHGEVTPYFPFLTAAGDPASAAEMLHEMATAGVLMAVLVTAVWGCMAVTADYLAKKAADPKKAGEE
ncbi:MAG: hypothetical protein K6D90_11335 [Lachnospiraceae bacterium]|nr:hypothetical protein [Lachnospiraceae bacterium]